MGGWPCAVSSPSPPPELPLTINGAINIMRRKGVGSVILNAGHKVFDLGPASRSCCAGRTRPTTSISAPLSHPEV
jgi:hypothetical protein